MEALPRLDGVDFSSAFIRGRDPGGGVFGSLDICGGGMDDDAMFLISRILVFPSHGGATGCGRLQES